jgi:predicted nucleotidyltransferase
MEAHGIDLSSGAIRDFCKKWKVRQLSVFGSFLREDFKPDSDLDFLADFEEDADWDLSDVAEMREELGAIVGREVDLMSRFALNSSRNWLFRKIVLSSLETVYASR